MAVIVIANPKGGVGKSTLATNVAGCLAAAGRAVMLGDIDRQQSSRQWLDLRPPALPLIQGWETGDGTVLKAPRGVSDVVLDTPAGLKGKRLEAALRLADRMLIPLQPSLFDIQATHAFIQQLQQHPRAATLRVGLVAMRVKDHTLSHEQLHRYLGTLPVPVVAWLRDTQNYVQLAAHGLTLWDVARSRVERDLEQWQPLQNWILA
jgi:chromosome partitioning protein